MSLTFLRKYTNIAELIFQKITDIPSSILSLRRTTVFTVTAIAGW